MQQIGYKRVSTLSQNTDRQLEGIELSRVFEDKVSGSTKHRPQLDAMLDHIRSGDAVHVHSIDRLARNLADLMSLIHAITDKGASIQFHKESMTFNGSNDAMQRMQMQIMGSVAEFERSMINERAAEGRAIAQAKGVKFGRKAALTNKQMAEVREQHTAGESVSKLAIDFDVARPAISRVLKSGSTIEI